MSSTFPVDAAFPDRLGRYEVLEALEGCGPRCLYRALDPLTRRAVALKAIRCQPGRPDREASDRRALHREAQAVGRLSHPGLVQIYDYGDDYFVMEFARGQTLAARLHQGRPFPLREAVVLLKALAAALDHAHSRGVLHGDLQPANVVLLADGAPKIVGFGQARILNEDEAETRPARPNPAYAAPERLLHETWGEPAEVFSLGVLAYEMLAARRPVDAEDPGLLGHRPSLPPVFDDVFAWALAKEPEHRPPTAGAFVQALESACPRDGRVPSRARLAPRRPLDDETFDLSFLLRPEEPRPDRATASAEAEAGLDVATDPAGAGVFLDGDHVGETPVWLRDLGPGPHILRLIRRGFATVQTVIETGRGRTRLIFTLQPLPKRRRVDRPGAITLAEVLRDSSASSWAAVRES
jgi:serine/threonine protein kinase